MHKWVSFLVLIIILQINGNYTQGQSAAKLVKGEMIFDNLERSYIYFTPKSLPKNAPLVVVLHGFTSNAENIMKYSAFNKLAEEEQFAVVYPQGTKDKKGNTFWNVGYDFHANLNIDDTGFVIALVKKLQDQYSLSNTNTFVTGMSNGGEMCYLLLCRYPTVFKAVAPVAGTMMESFFDDCTSPPSSPILAVFGTDDTTTNYEGDMGNKDGWGAYQSIPYIIDFWANAVNAQKMEKETFPNKVKTDSSFVVREKYYNESDKNELQFYKVIGGGHDWPGAWGNMDIDTSREIWDFFEKHKD